MKKYLLLFSFLIPFFAFQSVQAQQSDVTVFSEDGDPFFLVVNGIRQNDQAQTNVKVTGITATSNSAYRLKVIFEDKNKNDINKTLYPESGVEMVMMIRYKAKKDAYVLRIAGMNELPPANNAPAPIVYRTTAPPVQSGTSVVVTEQTTTTTTGGNNNGENVSINMDMNVDGFGGSISINANDGTGGTNMSSSSSVTTTTTTTTTSSGSMSGSMGGTASGTADNVYHMPGYNGPIGCSWPMAEADYQSAQSSVRSKDFEDSKLRIAKQIFNSNCLTSAQVKGIMMLFDFEDSKLNFAKYAYGRTYDIGNYYKVNDAFEFESSIDELDAYIQSQR